MPDPKPIEIGYLEPFIEATITAATRFRQVLIVLITASVLAFGAFWNARQGSWLNSRVEMARKGKKYLAAKDTLELIEADLEKLKLEKLKEETSPVPKEKEAERKAFDERLKALEERRGKLEHQRAQVQKDIGATNSDVKRWTDELYKFNNEGQIIPFIERLEAARVESVILLRIPFFGVVLDINDLGLIGGFTFVVILMWFRFSLWREYYNLRATFKEAKSEHLTFCYKSLAMRQVLTVPPTLSRRQPPQKPSGKIVRSLYFLPVLVQSTLFIFDLRTREFGMVISKSNTRISILMCAFFLILTSLLTYWCLRLSMKIDKKWDNVAKRIRKMQTQAAVPASE